MGLAFSAFLAAVGLFFGMLLFSEIGRRIGRARLASDPEGVDKGANPVQAAILGLLGLLLALTFTGAASRFEMRRHLITEEANAIGTAYLRIDLLPGDAQPEMRRLFRSYLDTRLEAYRRAEDLSAATAKLSEAAALQGKIWDAAVAACGRPDAAGHAARLFLPALNTMIDIATTRKAATRNHPPWSVFLLLAAFCLVSAMLLGYVMCGTKVRNWFYLVLAALAISLTFYVIVDLEFPRLGLIRVDSADRILMELREGMQ